MKKHLSLILVYVLHCCAARGQALPCYDFNSGDIGNWKTINCLINTVDAPYINALDLSHGVSVRDNHSASTFENSDDFKNLGYRFPGYCISFDYNISNDGRADTPAIHPTLYMSDSKGRTLFFVCNETVTQGNKWVHVSAPIAFYSTTGSYPANEYGYWYYYGKADDVDSIMRYSSKIFFSIDIVGSDVTTEDIRFDNICISKCADSFSKSCNPHFGFTLTATSVADHPQNNQGTLNLLEYHAKSNYQISWDDVTKTAYPGSHTFLPGKHTLIVNEQTEAGAKCRAGMDICVPEPVSKKMLAGPTDTPCHSDFMLSLYSATNQPEEANNKATIITFRRNPASRYQYAFGELPGTASLSPYYTYKPGSFEACTKEITAFDDICVSCLDFCVIKANTSSRSTTAISHTASTLNAISVIPNPAINEAALLFSLNEKESVSISIIDMTGRQLMNIPAENCSAGAHKINLNTALLSPGIYNIMLVAGQNVYSTRLSVLK